MFANLLIITYLWSQIDCKYVEGLLKTSENWAFLARFCFLSEEGVFEYDIQFNENQGDPNILLYYDTDDQWPAVYKSNKTCAERESVLNAGINQIVNLTAREPYFKEFSGCLYLPNVPSTNAPKYTLKFPKNSTKKITSKPKLTTKRIITTTEYSSSTNAEAAIISSTKSFAGSGGAKGFYDDESVSSTTEDFSYSTSEYLNLDYETITPLTSGFPIPQTHKPPIKRSLPTRPPMKDLRIGRTVSCHNARRFKSSRERWWFIAVSNCYGNQGINIKYRILMTNGAPGDYWHEHFSADEFYILPVLMAFSIAYSFLLLGIVMCTVELKSRQLLHTTYKIFVASVVFQLFGILLHSIAYLKYAVNGLGAPKLKRTGSVFMSASETCFLLLLLLLAKGFTVTRGRLPLPASIKLTIFMCIYVVTYISIFIYEARVFDPGEVLYLYESPAGYGLIVLRVFAWCMFIYSIIFTLKHYREKANFYFPFVIFGTLWFMAGPTFIITANTLIDKWVRESVVCAVLLFITFGGHLMFLILTMPSRANKNFPYHVRTTQIGIMELTGTSGTSTIEQFGHHIYEPSVIRQQTVIIPLTRRTEEIFEGMYNQRAFTRNSVDNDQINEPQTYGRDVALENVLNWSLAKNVPALELPNFENHYRSSIRSTLSNISHNTMENNELSSQKSPTTQNSAGNFDDYVRDVPVELFTVSKMVIATNGLNTSSDNNPQQ